MEKSVNVGGETSLVVLGSGFGRRQLACAEAGYGHDERLK
jgi:hypothetical protein